MKCEGAVALVVGVEGAVGAAIVRALYARDVAKVYAAPSDVENRPGPALAVEIEANPTASGYAHRLARHLTDVTLLILCRVTTESDAFRRAAVEASSRVADQAAVQANVLVEAFAPVLSANGGGAVVSMVSLLCTDRDSWSEGDTVDCMLADTLRDRLAAQRTQLLCCRAQLVMGLGEQQREDQHALAEHVAVKLLRRLEASDPSHEHDGNVRESLDPHRSMQGAPEKND